MGFAVTKLDLRLQILTIFELLVIIIERIVQIVKNYFFGLRILHLLLIKLILDQVSCLALSHRKFNFFQEVSLCLLQLGLASFKRVRLGELDQVLDFVKARLQNHKCLFKMILGHTVKCHKILNLCGQKFLKKLILQNSSWVQTVFFQI